MPSLRPRKSRLQNTGAGGDVKRQLTPERLHELRLERGHTLAEIARMHDCTKQYVSQLCQQYGIAAARASGRGR